MKKSLRTSITLLALALTPACATWYDAHFAPAPLEMKLEDASEGALAGRALISVAGVRRADAGQGRPVQFELALRIENLGSTPIEVDPEGFELATADLQTIHSVRMQPELPEPVAPGATSLIELAFPLPDGRKLRDYDISGINLRWAIRYADRRMVLGASFQRVWPARYDHDHVYDPFFPGWGLRYRIGFGGHVGPFCRY